MAAACGRVFVLLSLYSYKLGAWSLSLFEQLSLGVVISFIYFNVFSPQVKNIP